MNALGRQAQMASGVAGPEENQVYIFQQRLKQMGLDTDATTQRPVARKLYEQLRSGEEGQELRTAEQQIAGVKGPGSGDRGGGDKTQVSGNVQIGLTPEAAKLFSVVGGNTVALTKTQLGANRGYNGYQVNAPEPGEAGAS